jgi:hypothetical protein
MPWELIGTVLVGIIKWVFEKQAKRKLNDAEFLKHIEAHQKRRANAGKTAMDFEDSLQGALDEANGVKSEDDKTS